LDVQLDFDQTFTLIFLSDSHWTPWEFSGLAKFKNNR